MHTATSIIIRAPREQVFSTVQDLERWPEHLPHYRYVKVLRQDGLRQVVEMSATRSGIPITWVSAYRTDTQQLELHFEHLRKWTKGMVVVWYLTPTRDGCRVEIVHDLRFRWRLLAWFAEPIIGRFFIDNIANKTLRTFKELIERNQPAAVAAASEAR